MSLTIFPAKSHPRLTEEQILDFMNDHNIDLFSDDVPSFLSDDSGRPSSVRLFGLILVVIGSIIGLIATFIGSEVGGWISISIIALALTGKVAQKKIERR